MKLLSRFMFKSKFIPHAFLKSIATDIQKHQYIYPPIPPCMPANTCTSQSITCFPVCDHYWWSLAVLQCLTKEPVEMAIIALWKWSPVATSQEQSTSMNGAYSYFSYCFFIFLSSPHCPSCQKRLICPNCLPLLDRQLNNDWFGCTPPGHFSFTKIGKFTVLIFTWFSSHRVSLTELELNVNYANKKKYEFHDIIKSSF